MAFQRIPRQRVPLVAGALSLFQKTGKPGNLTAQDTKATRERTAAGRIRCPRCGWQPTDTTRWVCAPCPEPENFLGGCRTLWNTFSTRGKCPGCGHQWRWTSCARCRKWSLHADWYVEDPASSENAKG